MQDPAAVVIVQVQGEPPLYEHVQIEPLQDALQMLPAWSWHDVVDIVGSPGPATPPPEHEYGPPAGRRGIAEHTVLGTVQLLPLGGMVVVPEDPQACKACIAESQPGNATSPACVQLGSVDSAQRRYASSSDAQDVMDDAMAQSALQSAPRAANAHPARVILSQIAEHDAET